MRALPGSGMPVVLRLRFGQIAAVLAALLLVAVVGLRVYRALTEPELSKAMKELAVLGFVPTRILDIGANEGTWTETMQGWVPGASFFQIEGNMALEHFLKEKGRPYRIAIVGDEEKTVTFHKLCDGGLCSGGSSVFEENTKWGPGMIKEERQMTTVDRLVAQAQQAPFDMMKLDIQGAELLALKGAPRPPAAPRHPPPALTGATARRRGDGDAEERAGDPGGDLKRRVQQGCALDGGDAELLRLDRLPGVRHRRGAPQVRAARQPEAGARHHVPGRLYLRAQGQRDPRRGRRLLA